MKHVLEVLDAAAAKALHPMEQAIVRVARGAGVTVHRCSCGTLISSKDLGDIEVRHGEHLRAVHAARAFNAGGVL